MLQVRFGEHTSYNEVTYFVAKSLLDSLKISGEIGESRMQWLLQLIIGCIKSNHVEFQALGGIIFARVLPLARLKKKVVNKLLKVVEKVSAEPNLNSMNMIMILLRTQRDAIKMDKVIQVLARHRDQLLNALDPQRAENDDGTYCLRLLENLTLLAEFACNGHDFGPECQPLFEGLVKATKELQVREELAIRLVTCVSQAYVKAKDLRKKTKKSR